MTYQEVSKWLLEQNEILILTHRSPDGDTVGCSVGLCAALREQGKTAYVMKNEDITPQFSHYMEAYLAPEGFEPLFVVAVDIADTMLFTKEGDKWLKHGIDLAIDHHPSHSGYAKQTCVDASRSACGELIYDIVSLWGDISKEVALPLYVAVSTDTGCFLYGNTTAETHRVAATLIETGIDIQPINRLHFRTKSRKRLLVEAMMVENMDCYDDGAIVIGSVSLADLERLGANDHDVEDIASFLGEIEGVKVAATIKESKNGLCKISLRTVGLNATKVCGLLGGGGHAAAAGCRVEGDVATARAAIYKAIRQVQADG